MSVDKEEIKNNSETNEFTKPKERRKRQANESRMEVSIKVKF